MDNRSGNPDRADTLRSLPRPFARRSLQVLQSALQHDARNTDGSETPGIRGPGDPPGNQQYIGAECEHCGGPLPEGSSAHRMYCSKACKNAAWTAKVRAKRIAERQDRKCLWCSGPIAPEARGDVIYCSKTCQGSSQRDMEKKRGICPQCGKAFRGYGKFCSHSCYSKSKRKLHPKKCPVCQKVFKPHRIEQVCCSRGCQHERAKRAR